MPMPDTLAGESHNLEAVSPSLNLGAVNALRSTWLGPGWAALCGLVASAALTSSGLDVLIAVLVFIVADWAWPAIWTTCVRTDWLASFAHWAELAVSAPARRPPYLQPGSPGDRLLAGLARLGAWWRAIGASMLGASLTSGLVASIVGLALSAAIGWRALALTLAVFALTALGVLRALRASIDSDGLRAIVYGVLPWWLGHAAFAPPTAESAGMAILFGAVYWTLMASGDRAPSTARLIAPQILAAIALFAGRAIWPAFIVGLAIFAQVALRTFLSEHDFARRAQVWLIPAMLACAIAVG